MKSRRFGIHAAVFVGAWDMQSARRAIDGAALAGFDLIEVPVFDPTRIDIKGTAALLAQAGIGAACSLGLPFDADISSTDETIARRGVDYLCAAVEVAAGVRSDYVGGVTYGAFGKHPAPLAPQGRLASLRGLEEVATFAAERGVTIGLECVNRYESNLLNTAEQALRYLAELDRPNVVVHLDTYHANIEESDPVSAIQMCAEKLGYVHIGENHRGALGSGRINLAEWADALDGIGYDGVITFESFSSVIVDPNLSNTLAVWRDTWTDPDAVAADARRVMERTFR